MNLISMLKSHKSLMILCIFLVCNELSWAAWEGPKEIVAGKWGSGINEFGIEYGDMENRIPWLTAILSDGKIVLDDGVNERFAIYYPDGNLYKVVPWYLYDEKQSNKRVNPEFPKYQYWNFKAYTAEGNIWYKIDHYLLKSPAGELLNTTSTPPSEMGIVETKQSSAKGLSEVIIIYPDKKYILDSPRQNQYIRDKFSNLNGITNNVVNKYSSDGHFLGQLVVQGDKHTVLIDFSGNVFALKTTTGLFKVLKWTWKN